jgi:plastocyanin
MRLSYVTACLATSVLLADSAAAIEHLVTANPDLTFSPASLVVARGDTVRFHNGGGTHNVHADDDRFVCSVNCTTNNGPNGADWSAVVAFDEAGTFGYYCEKHGGTGSGMRGTIIVVDDHVFADGFDAAAAGSADRAASSVSERSPAA